MGRTHLTAAGLMVLLLVSGVAFGSVEVIRPAELSREILVQYEPGIDTIRFDAMCSGLSEMGFAFVRAYPWSRVIRLQIPDCDSVESAIERSSRIPGVLHSERPYRCHVCGVPNDQYYYLQWNLSRLGFENAWDLYLDEADFLDPAVIAVLDTGVAYENYTDGNYTYEKAPDFGDIDFVDGYDVVNDDYHPNDDNGHGTFTCGVIAQSTDNSSGIASIGFGCKIMPVKVLGEYQCGDSASVTEGIYYAVNNGCLLYTSDAADD